MPTVNSDTFYTTAEAAVELGISQESVRKYCANYESGKTPALKGELMGRSWFIPPKEIERYLEERKDRGRPRQAG